jgi:hypothetical protein
MHSIAILLPRKIITIFSLAMEQPPVECTLISIETELTLLIEQTHERGAKRNSEMTTGDRIYLVFDNGQVNSTKGGELLFSRSQFCTAPSFLFKAHLSRVPTSFQPVVFDKKNYSRRYILAATQEDAMAVRAKLCEYMVHCMNRDNIINPDDFGFYTTKRNLLAQVQKKNALDARTRETEKRKCSDDTVDNNQCKAAKVATTSNDDVEEYFPFELQ